MNDLIGTLLVLVLLLLIALITLIIGIIRIVYHNGVRDGYQNTFLPHVRKQIQEEGLTQGEEVAIPNKEIL